MSRLQESRAASDDERGNTAGRGASSTSAPAAVRKACAGAATGKAGKAGRTPKQEGAGKKGEKKPPKRRTTWEKGESKPRTGGDDPVESLWDERAQLDGGVELPEDGIGFVDAVNVNIDLIRLTEILLRGTDERSSKSLLERLLEMRYGKNPRVAEGLSRAIGNDPAGGAQGSTMDGSGFGQGEVESKSGGEAPHSKGEK